MQVTSTIKFTLTGSLLIAADHFNFTAFYAITALLSVMAQSLSCMVNLNLFPSAYAFAFKFLLRLCQNDFLPSWQKWRLTREYKPYNPYKLYKVTILPICAIKVHIITLQSLYALYSLYGLSFRRNRISVDANSREFADGIGICRRWAF